MILYNAQSDYGGADFLALGLRNGIPELSFNVGSGTAVISAEKPITFGKWHTIKIARNRKNGTIIVDDNLPIEGAVRGRFVGLDLGTELFLGGAPPEVNYALDTGFENGFVGMNLEINF